MTTSQKEILLKDLREEADTCRHKDVQDIEAANLLDRAIAFISAPSTEGNPETPWEEAQRISDLPNIDEEIRNLCNDPTNDNAVCLVRSIMTLCRPDAVPATPPTQALAEPQELSDVLQRICDMQKRNYGNATMTHIELSSLCEEVRALLTGKRTS